jgi:hypothetical protein
MYAYERGLAFAIFDLAIFSGVYKDEKQRPIKNI